MWKLQQMSSSMKCKHAVIYEQYYVFSQYQLQRHSSQITIMITISISVSIVSTSFFVDYYKELQRQEVLADMRAKVCCMFLSLTFSLSQHLAT